MMSGTLRFALAGALALAVAVFDRSAHAVDGAELAGACASCHGIGGPPVDELTPQITGLRKKHILTAMGDYRSGQRPHEPMQQAASDLADADLDVLATWLSEQEWVAASSAVDGELATAGSKKARSACSSCHRLSGQGNIQAPRLAGQPVAYLIAASAAYRDSVRTSPAARGKAFVMGGLSDDEILALSHYYAGLR